jgi:hypothetical protein
MSDQQQTPWGESVVCPGCGRRLKALSYALSLDDDPRGAAQYPHLRCAGCGRCYQWQDARTRLDTMRTVSQAQRAAADDRLMESAGDQPTEFRQP